jgi:excinuclease UvrABC ATPase subunit
VVAHKDTIERADYVIDIGPKAKIWCEIISIGTPAETLKLQIQLQRNI